VYLSFDNWGFGDADTSAAKGQRHEGLPQNRRVTSNDARVIMRSMVTKVWLDSVWKRQAYQGDVNHSGRYYFTKLKRDFSADSLDGQGNVVIWRRTIDVDQFTGKQVLRVLNESQGLYGVGGRAPDVSSLNQIYYEVTEYDAALIMRYLSGRLPYLPWIYDNDTTGPDFGKVTGDNVAEGMRFGQPVSIGNGLVRIPVMFNAAHSGAFGLRFETDADIVGLTPIESIGTTVGADNGERVGVLAGNGEFEANTPVAYVTMKQQPVFTFGDIRYNEANMPGTKLNGGDLASASAVTTYPNPMNASASVVVNVPEAGNVTVTIHDVYGGTVATLFEGSVSAGTLPLSWTGVDANGNAVVSGAYLVRVNGAGVSETCKVTVAR
jgi:hypothetical protein